MDRSYIEDMKFQIKFEYEYSNEFEITIILNQGVSL